MFYIIGNVQFKGWDSFKNYLYLDLTKPIEWPALVICKLPRDKNEEKYENFMEKAKKESFDSQNTFQEMINEIFYTNPKELIHGVSIAKSYLEAIKRYVLILNL